MASCKDWGALTAMATMLAAFASLEFLTAWHGGHWALIAQFAQGCHVVACSPTPMRSGPLGLGTLADLPD